MTLGTVSICFVLEDDQSVEGISRLVEAVDALRYKTETVLIVNSAKPERTKELLPLADLFAGGTLLFLDRRVERDFARLVAIDNAIGDVVALCDPRAPDPSLWADLIAGVEAGVDHSYPVYGEGSGAGRSLLRRLFFKFYESVGRISLLTPSPGSLALSRAAAVYVLNRIDGEMLLKAKNIGPGFVSESLVVRGKAPALPQRRLAESIKKGYRVLRHVGSIPVRATVAVAMGGALLSLCYALYTVYSYFLVSHLAPGWVTLSLVLSVMFFFFSILLGLIGDHLAAIEQSLSYRLRYTVVREARGSRPERSLNLSTRNESSLPTPSRKCPPT